LRALLGALLFATIVVAILVFVVVPYLAGPVITGVLQSTGIVQGGDVSVETKGTGAELVRGHADAVRVQGQDVALQGLTIGDADVTLRDVALFERTFQAVDGTLERVRVPVTNGPVVTIASIDLDGPADAVAATGKLDAEEAAEVIREATEQAGVRIDEATLGDGVIRLRRGDLSIDAVLSVRNGSLILDPNGGLPSVVLMKSTGNDPWQLDRVTVTSAGLAISGILDVRDLIDGTDALTR
jgi:hypothetical protein